MIIGRTKYESEKSKNMNNELKLNIDEQQDETTHFFKYWDIDEIETPWKEMDVCVACNQTIAKKSWLKNTYPARAHKAVVKLL